MDLPVAKNGLNGMDVENRLVLFWRGVIGEIAARLKSFPLVIRSHLGCRLYG